MKSTEFITEEEATTSAIARRKYPNSCFPEITAKNKRDKAKKRLEKMKTKSSNSNNGGGESNLGSPLGGSSSGNDY